METEDFSASYRVRNMLGVTASAVAYGILLRKTRLGKMVNKRLPSAVMFCGAIISLIWLAFEDPKAAGKTLIYFVLFISPAFVESLPTLQNFLEGEDDDDDEEVEYSG